MTVDADWLARAAGGRLMLGEPGAKLRGVLKVDTRLLEPGDVFVGLPGDRVDGGSLVAEALELGAAGVIVQPPHLDHVERPTIAIEVDDAHEALVKVAKEWRQRLVGHVIGVTGAVGKTTTTEILAALLSPRLRTQATRHGFNTRQGVAATVAGAPADTQCLIVELAMNRRGQIADRALVAQPTAGLITNIGPEHLSTAGSVAGVARNKAELIAALPPGAPCVVPADEPLLDPHLRTDLRTITHGLGGDVSLSGFERGVAEVATPDGPLRLELAFSQPHRLRNTVAAAAMAWTLGLATECRPRVGFSPLRWQQARIGPVELVMDCAKTSPLALAAALDDFSAEPASRRIAVLGPLPDLGHEMAGYQRLAGRRAAAAGIDLLVCVGEAARTYRDGFPGEVHEVGSPTEARALIKSIGMAGDRVLVKGARQSRLGDILQG